MQIRIPEHVYVWYLKSVYIRNATCICKQFKWFNIIAKRIYLNLVKVQNPPEKKKKKIHCGVALAESTTNANTPNMTSFSSHAMTPFELRFLSGCARRVLFATTRQQVWQSALISEFTMANRTDCFRNHTFPYQRLSASITNWEVQIISPTAFVARIILRLCCVLFVQVCESKCMCEANTIFCVLYIGGWRCHYHRWIAVLSYFPALYAYLHNSA